MKITFDTHTTFSFNKATQHEWLETNGLGGWASSTIIGTNTRRYHGLLVAASRPPIGRQVLLSKLDETLNIKGKSYPLYCNSFQGAIVPEGYIFLQQMVQGIFPEFYYEAGGVKLKKTIVCVNGENTTVILYEVLAAPEGFELALNPLVAARDFHQLNHAGNHFSTNFEYGEGRFFCQPTASSLPLHLVVPGAEFTSAPDWYYNFKYQEEHQRGQDSTEDLFSYGKFTVRLEAGQKIGVIASTQPCMDRDAFDMVQQEETRRKEIVKESGVNHPILQKLVLAGDQFIVQRGDNLRSIIAGYHWFSDWGRDTMISLPGLCLTTGRYADARKILHAFSKHLNQGILPNRFPDDQHVPEYNTMDATLWFFVAVYKYYQATNDKAFVAMTLLPVMEDILNWHQKGTHYGIHMAEDGLLAAYADDAALSWMDAKVDNWVVTPRKGKPVEINALWYNAIEIYARLQKELGSREAYQLGKQLARKVRKSFLKTFWNEKLNCLYDCVDGDFKDDSIRPNQLFAVSLPFMVIPPKKAWGVLKQVESRLFTPFGLRSLCKENPAYKGVYDGDQWQRDGAYHQGTVWSWLIGPYIDAIIRVKGELGREQARWLIRDFADHFRDAGTGSVSEIFDGDEPQSAKGCIAQAWSVAELLRVSVAYQLLEDPTSPFAPPPHRKPVMQELVGIKRYWEC